MERFRLRKSHHRYKITIYSFPRAVSGSTSFFSLSLLPGVLDRVVHQQIECQNSNANNKHTVPPSESLHRLPKMQDESNFPVGHLIVFVKMLYHGHLNKKWYVSYVRHPIYKDYIALYRHEPTDVPESNSSQFRIIGVTKCRPASNTSSRVCLQQ
jgi:hypothetical protein